MIKKCFFLIFLSMSGLSYSQNLLSRLSVQNNQFVDENGEVIVLRGVSTSDPDKLEKDGQWKESYFQEIKSWGANIVRFPIHPPRWRERGQENYLKLLDQGIKWAEEMQLYVIIDWHSIGNLKSELFFLPIYETSLKETKEFWRIIGGRYGNHTAVAFYEFFNEPTTYEGRLGYCSWDDWKVINEELITIVRANGGEGIPLVAGFNWAYDLSDPFSNPIEADGVGYVSHPYPQKRPQPWDVSWTSDWGKMKEKAPVVLTEIGFALVDELGAHIPVISDEQYGEAITSYCDSRDISYVVWVFDAEWDPKLFNVWDTFAPTRQGAYFKEKLQSYNK